MPKLDSISSLVINFADSQKEVHSVYLGMDPEEESPVYYLITRSRFFDFDLAERIGDFEFSRDELFDVNLSQWPDTEEPYWFMGKRIWSRD